VTAGSAAPMRSQASALRHEYARASGWLSSREPARVLLVFVLAQWAIVLGIFIEVRHAGWLFYQGGDQLWYYTTAWVLVHGHLPWPGVGYLWSIFLAPFALVGGANLLATLPAIILVNVVVLLPATLFALWGIAQRIGGRVFAYWVLTVWLVVPPVGILYTNAGYHQKYTELLLPQGFGLTAMADFPAMAASTIAVYFVAKAVLDERPSLVDALAGGIAAGAAIAVKPSASILLAGPALAFVFTRRVRPAAVFAVGVLPAAVTLALWKWRAYGHVPIGSAAGHAGTASLAPLLAVAVHLPSLSWSHLSHEFDLLREHFWSGRLIQWFVVAGVIGLARRSRPAVLLVAGWFGMYVIVKGTYLYASIEDGSLERLMIPAFPAFILLLASIPMLAPGIRRKPPGDARASLRISPRAKLSFVIASLLATGVVPFVAIAAVAPERSTHLHEAFLQQPPIPIDIDLGLSATPTPDGVALRWRAQHPAGGPVFFHIYRTDPSQPSFGKCVDARAASRCFALISDVHVVKAGSRFLDHAPPGRWSYRIGLAANWLDDPTGGDVYLLSRQVTVSVP
jgi:hypothetical protein